MRCAFHATVITTVAALCVLTVLVCIDDNVIAAKGKNGVAVNPRSGTGKEQLFTLVYTGDITHNRLSTVRLLVNSTLDGRNACYVYFDVRSTTLHLVNDSGIESRHAAPGQPVTLANSQCELDASRSSVQSLSGPSTLRLSLTFFSAFGGRKNLYTLVEQQNGGSPRFERTGDWTVPTSYLRSTTR